MHDLQIIHLVNDTMAGGVKRLLNQITTLPRSSIYSRQKMCVVKRGAFSHGKFCADVIVSHLSISWRSLPALMALRAIHPNARLVHIEHCYSKAFTASNCPKRKNFFTLLQVAYSLFDQVVAVSEGQGRWLRKSNLVENDNLTVIPNSTNLDWIFKLPPPRFCPRVIGAIGRLDYQKGFDILIQAFRLCENPEMRLRIIGDGPQKPALEKLAKGDHRIEFHGCENDLAALYSKVDAVAITSRWDASGLVALEARASGRPVLVANIDGLKDHVGQGVVPVDGGHPKTWAANLMRLCATDHDLKPFSGAEIAILNNRFVERWRTVLGIGSHLIQPE